MCSDIAGHILVVTRLITRSYHPYNVIFWRVWRCASDRLQGPDMQGLQSIFRHGMGTTQPANFGI